MKRHNLLSMLGAVVLATAPAVCATVTEDAAAIVTTATTSFTAVATLVVTAVGFWVIIRIVRKIRG